MNYLATTVFTFVCFSTFCQAQNTGKIQRDLYSIEYPLSWNIDTSKQIGADLFIISKKESDLDKFKENINVLIQDISEMGLDLDKYVSISEQQIKSMLSDTSMVESKRISLENKVYHKLIYTGLSGEFNLKFEQYYFLTLEKAFVITLTTEADKFDSFKPIGEKVLDSFKLKN